MAVENIRCDVDENLWPDQQEWPGCLTIYIFFFHGCYFVVILCIFGNIRKMKCTVIGQVRFHLTYSKVVQK